MRKKIISLALISFLSISTIFLGCGKKDDDSNKKLTVSIAASLQKPMDDIKSEYEKETGTQIEYNAGGSGTLKKQISKGAEVDLFLSANTKYVDELINEGLVNKGKSYDLLTNSLVLIEGNDVNKEVKNLDQLKDIDGKIAIGEVSTVPAGEYTKQTLEHLKLWKDLESKFVFANSVTNVKNYVENGEAPFGFVYKTDAIGMKNSKIAYEIPNEYHKNIKYSLCLLKDSKNKEESEKFIQFLKSKKSKEIFEKYGFGVE